MVSDLFNSAELAMAAYANLVSGSTSSQVNDLTDESSGFSTKQAEEFAKRYTEVITQYNDTETSFSATVFKDVTGNLTLAIRGTAELFDVPGDILPTDFDIGVHGAGYDQILAMHNWWSRVTAQPGQNVQQFGSQSYMRGASNDPVPEGAVLLYSTGGGSAFPASDTYMIPLGTVAASGELAQALALDSDARLDVTGHSLGGHLAMAFGTLFANQTNQVTVFNTPGFIDSTRNQNFFAALGGSVPIGQSTTNVIANEASANDVQWNAIAGIHSRPGTAVDIAIEDQAGLNSDEPPSTAAGARNHSQMILTDALAVYSLLNELAPTFSTDNYKYVLNSAVQGTSGSYEGIIDVLESVFNINDTVLPVGNDQRDALYNAIYAVRDKSSPYNGQLVISDTESLAALSQLNSDDGFAYRYALVNLNNFAISGNNLYSQHNNSGELNADNFTEHYLQDRAEMLSVKNQFALEDINQQFNSTDGNRVFKDLETELILRQTDDQNSSQLIDLKREQYLFGSNNAEISGELEGGIKDDHLYGGGGFDIIKGNKGNDYIEGNRGDDVLYGDDGSDILIGGSGGDNLHGGKSGDHADILDGGTGHDIYHIETTDGDTIIRDSDLQGQIEYDSNTLGINIKAVVDGGNLYKDDDGHQYSIIGQDLEIKLATTHQKITIENYGSSFVDALGLHFNVADTIDHSSGSVIHGGGSNDALEGGAGKDIIYGNAGTDIVDGFGGDDILYADGEQSIADAMAATVGTNQRGSLLSGGYVFDSGADTLIGNTGNDLLLGGDGEDILIGSAGDDILLGDYTLIRPANHTYHDWNFYYSFSLENSSANITEYKLTFYDTLRYIDNHPTLPTGYYEVFDRFTPHLPLRGSADSDGDLLYGGSGNDLLYGFAGDDHLEGGNDNDILIGSYGNDILFGGEGNDVLIGDENFTWSDNTNYTEVIAGDDFLYGGAGKDILLGNVGDDSLNGGTGDGDYLEGGEGNDTYLFSAGDGNTTINNYDTSASQDTLQINVSSVDVSAKRSNLDLLLTVLNTAEVITVQNHFLDNLYVLNNIQFSDATSWDEDTIKTLVFQGTQGDDYIAGYASDDVISGLGGDDDLHGGSGNDTLQGGKGNDLLEGGTGDDRYLFNLGDGHDIINDNLHVPLIALNSLANGIDTLVLGENINPAQLTAQRGTGAQANDVIIHIDADNSITIQGWFDANTTVGGQFLSPRKIEFFEFLNGRRATANQIETLLTGERLNFAPIITSTIADQQLDFNQAIDFTIPTDTFTDLEGDALTITATLADGSGLPEWLSFDSQTGQFSGLPPVSAPSQQDIKIIATDMGGLSTAPVNFSFSITPEIKVGDEFIISTDNGAPSITVLANGGSFVQWTNYNGIVGQMYSKDGQPFGGQVSIQDDGDHISTAALTDGGVVIVWAHTEPDPENNGIFGQRYSDAGIAMGDKFLISADGYHYFDDYLGDIANSEGGDLGGTGSGGPLLPRASSPIIASNADGFLVTWTERQSQQNYMDANETHVQYHNFSRWYDVSNEALSPGLMSLPEERTAVFNDFYGRGFDAYGYYDELADQQLLARDDGTFMLVNWGAFSAGDSGRVYHGLNASTIDTSSGYLDIISNELSITAEHYSDQRDSEFAITTLADGGHVIVWQNMDSRRGIYAQRYDSTGAELGAKIKVNSDGGQPSVLSLSDGSFIIEWTGANHSFGQRYDLDGNLVERKFQISSSSLENAEGDPILFGGKAELVETRPGEIFVTWQGVNANNYDRDVVGKRLSYTYLGSHNTAPELSQAISDQSSNEDALFTFTLPVDTFTDSDVGDSLTLTASLADDSALPTWLSFDAVSQTFSGTPDNDQVGLLELKVTATDNDGLTVSDTFALTINNVNDAPTISLALLDQTVDEDNLFNFTLPANTFNDVDAGDSVALSATLADGSALPTWLSFDAVSQTFSGTPDNDQVGLLELKVTATDNDGLTVSDTFNLTINNINDAPIVNGTLVDQTSDEDSLFSYQLPSDTFTDIDTGDNLTLSATLADGSVLPSWLSFDALTQTFSGTPPLDASGVYGFKVSATDNGGLAVDTSFSLTINDVTTGDTGNDRLRVNGDHQTINSGEGNDSVVAVGDYNQLNGGEGRDRVRAYGSHNTVNGGTGNDTAIVIGHNSTVNGGEGNDRIGARGNNNTFNGGDGNDSIRAYSNNGIFNGDAGNDTLYANGDNNTLNGGDGNDRLKVRRTATNTIFNGGKGDDRIVGSRNNDTYHFTIGDGHDTLIEKGHTVDGTDTLQFGQGIEADDLWFERAANDLEITIYNSDDSVTIKDWYTDDNHKIDAIKLSDGQALMNNQLDQLVQAMATFGVPAAGTSELTGQIKDEIAPVIAASWG